MDLLLNFSMKIFAVEIATGSEEFMNILPTVELKILTARNINDRNLIRKTYLTFAPLCQNTALFCPSACFCAKIFDKPEIHYDSDIFIKINLLFLIILYKD